MRRSRMKHALRVEGLESRNLLSVYFVATNGSDSNPGTIAAPWATLQHAVDSIKAGSTIEVESGTYVGCRIGNSGTAAARDTLEAAPGANVLIDAPGPDNKHGSDIEVENFSGTVKDWTIKGLEVTSAPTAGIDIRVSNHISVLDCDVHNNTIWGIFTAFTDYLNLTGNTASYSAQQHGIYVSNSSEDCTIVDNVVAFNHDCGIQVNADASEGGSGISTGFTIIGNDAHDNGVGGGAALNFDGLQKSTIANNTLVNNHAGGIVLYHYNAAAGSIDNKVTGNTIQMAAGARYAININSDSTGNKLSNNTIDSTSGDIAIDAGSLSGFTSNDNTFGAGAYFSDQGDSGPELTLAQWQKATGQDKNSIEASS